jgi:hypothetical protein
MGNRDREVFPSALNSQIFFSGKGGEKML